jgi:energy-coupling factor transport system permease protein
VNESKVHPYARGLAAFLALVGSALINSTQPMALVVLCVLAPLLIAARVFRAYAVFCLTILLPISVGLFTVWGFLVAAPPGSTPGSNQLGGMQFAGVVTMRLALFAGIFQLAFLTIPSDQLAYTLSRWGLKKEWLIIVLGAFTLAPELARRADQIYVARYARGLAQGRSVFQRAKQLPYMLRPLMTWALRSSLQRSEIWNQRRLLTGIEASSGPTESSVFLNLFYVGLGLCWLTCAVLLRLQFLHLRI